MHQYTAQIYSVIDGDTVGAIVDLGFDTRIKIHIRLYGIDAPTITKNNPEGLEAMQWLSDRVLNQTLILHTHKQKGQRLRDKYGRVLGELALLGEERTINMQMLDLGLASPYFGGDKINL